MNSHNQLDFMHSQHQILDNNQNPNHFQIQSPSFSQLMSFDDADLCASNQKKRFSISELIHPVIKSKTKILYKIRIRKHIENYIKNLKNYTLIRKTNQLKQLHYELINDKASISANQNDLQQLPQKQIPSSKARILSSKTLLKIQKIQRFSKFMFPIIHQGSNFFIFWNCIVLLCILYNFYLIPLRLVYQESFYELECQYRPFVLIQFCIFLIDILIIMNTSIIIQDKIVTDRKQIFFCYLKSNRFFKDIISIVGFIIIVKPIFYENCSQEQSTIEKLMSFMFFIKYSKIQKLYNKMERQITLSQNLLTTIKLFRLMINFLMIAHYVACFWILTGQFGRGQNQITWLDAYGLNNSDWVSQYITALYFSLMTMTTVGYGDIAPQNNVEKIVNMIMMVLACAAFGFIINKIAGIIDELENKKNQYHRELNILNKYMQKLNISQNLRARVRNYFKMFWKTNLVQQFEQEAEVINKLSKSLQEELVVDHLGEILKQIPIMKQNFSISFLQQLSLKMRQYTLTPNETIQQTDDDQMIEDKLICIGQGEAEIQYKKNDGQIIDIGTLSEGEHFGLYNIFQLNDQENRNILIKAKNFSVVYELSKSEFLNILYAFPEDYERYCAIRDNQIYNRVQQRQLYGSCLLCEEDDHQLENCLSVHYQTKKNYAIYRSQYSRPNLRSNIIRKKLKLVENENIRESNNDRINSLKNLKYIREECEEYQNKLSVSDSEQEGLSDDKDSFNPDEKISQGCITGKLEQSEKKKNECVSAVVLELESKRHQKESQTERDHNKKYSIQFNDIQIDSMYQGTVYLPCHQIHKVLKSINSYIAKRIHRKKRTTLKIK